MLHGSRHKLNFNLLYRAKKLIIKYLLYNWTNFTTSQEIIEDTMSYLVLFSIDKPIFIKMVSQKSFVQID